VLRKGGRAKWLIAAACLAVVGPAAYLVSGMAVTAAPTPQATPVVDPNYVYNQLFDMAYNDVYRVSGADGPPTDPSSPWNVPPTVNGWQEFFQHWKAQLTDTSVMGSLAKFATVSDHYFHRLPVQETNPDYSFDPNYRWDSDDAEVTIPGANCAGQRVLLAAHPDGTPVSPTIVGQVNNSQNSTSPVFGFGAGRRTLTLSNVANGGAYDDTSGVAMTMGEYQALLQWYQANNTYPSKTLKVALLDASAGRAKDGTFLREGSKYYAANLIPKGPQGQYVMFAEMNANGLSYPAYHLGTQYFWNNLSGGGVGPWRTFVTDTPSTPNQNYPDTGPGSPGANISANSAAITQFNTNLNNAVSAGFAQQSAKYGGTVTQENPLRYNGTGSAPGGLSAGNGGPQLPTTPDVPAYTAAQQAQYSPVHPAGTAPEAEILSTEDDAAAFWNLGIPGFSVGGVQDSNIDENPYAPTVSASIRATPILQYTGGGTGFELASNVPSAAFDKLQAATAAGDTTVTVATGTNFTAGQPFFVDTGANLEVGQIQSVNGNVLTLTAPLKLAHAAGVPFNVNQGQPVGFTGDTTEHLNFFASGAPHGLGGENVPSQELLRALELPSTYTSLLVSGSDYLGTAPKPTTAVAYFETTPVNPTSTLTVTFDASFARNHDGTTSGLKYFWDFGDGKTAVGKTVTHTFTSPTWADVKLVVGESTSNDNSQGNNNNQGNAVVNFGLYRQAVAVDSPSGAAPSTPACGTFSAAERAALIKAAQSAFNGKENQQ
jgi:hypothetical protein